MAYDGPALNYFPFFSPIIFVMILPDLFNVHNNIDTLLLERALLLLLSTYRVINTCPKMIREIMQTILASNKLQVI